MITLSDLTELLGWASIINIGVLMITTFFLTVMRSFVLSIHSKIFGLNENELLKIYVKFIGNYKMFIFIVNLSPYLSLKIMGH